MKNFKVTIVSMCLIMWPVDCIPRKIKSANTKEFKKSGEAIALDNLIEKYEKEHQKFYEEGIKDGHYLEWTLLENKTLSDYCDEYLGCCVPTRTSANTTGTKIVGPLHYVTLKASTVSVVVIVQCKILSKNSSYFYYITRAQKPNCVYSLKSTKISIQSIFTIINKYCDFEDNQSIKKILKRKRKRIEITGRIHRDTGQPIAKDRYLLEYELEHQELLTKEGEEGKCIDWPYAIKHHNLNTYCHQYMKECVPNRERKNVKGSWKLERLGYQKLNTNEYINIILVTCVSLNGPQQRYYITRAPESNCVFALLRKMFKSVSPYKIVYKHCDFEDISNQPILLRDINIPDSKKALKFEVKEEMEVTFGTMQLFPEF